MGVLTADRALSIKKKSIIFFSTSKHSSEEANTSSPNISRPPTMPLRPFQNCRSRRLGIKNNVVSPVLRENDAIKLHVSKFFGKT